MRKREKMNNKNLSINDLLEMSRKLHELNKDKWEPMIPEHGRDSVLYMIEEIGEVISVLKKKTVDEIMNTDVVREHFVEELSDVLMYFVDTLNRFEVSSEEFSSAYAKKYEYNVNRNFKKDHEDFIHKI